MQRLRVGRARRKLISQHAESLLLLPCFKILEVLLPRDKELGSVGGMLVGRSFHLARSNAAARRGSFGGSGGKVIGWRDANGGKQSIGFRPASS